MPGDEELVMALIPVAAARTMLMEAISLSAWRKAASSMRLDMYSGISFWGVMG